MDQQTVLAVKPDNLSFIPKFKWKERRNSHKLGSDYLHRLYAPTHIDTCKNQSINKHNKGKEGNKISSVKQRCPVWMFSKILSFSCVCYCCWDEMLWPKVIWGRVYFGVWSQRARCPWWWWSWRIAEEAEESQLEVGSTCKP